MIKIKWDGQAYMFDEKICYDTESLIVLPNGTILKVEDWKSLIPLIPGRLRKVPIVKAVLIENSDE